MLNLNLNLNLNDLSLLGGKESIPSQQEQHGVAVIGMDVKAGAALNKDAVWQAFCEGLDMITELPEKRALDARDYARRVYGRDIQNFSHRAYLPEIDGFEPELFKLSHREAELMDPVQRLYLESAWCALEDAGYGGNRLSGSKTGVYVGYNQVGESYESLLKDIPQESLGISLSGNVTSFLASRISYLLDLTGPAMVIDTACSSSLVALHLACKALRSKEIDQAIVGSIRIFFCPEKTGEDIGTTSSSDRTKSFDASADGTGGGEGIISLVLKPLRAAVRDRDHIYGVIKGSCANQDGSSIGITAPNSAAQEKAILQAWTEAQIDPEKISYIEAHGTATRLGDPVEIGGLTAAFSHYTQRRQFCALGAAKSNFGHLDCCSGLLGVVKVLLMMEHRMIPPSLHFCAPNLKIDYTNSPIYMNDSLKPWTTEDGVLTAGVSSFGLSGTNCHVVLQSYDAANEPMTLELTHELLTVSARTKSSLRSYLLGLQVYLRNHGDLSLRNVCYSLNVGRSQQRCRFAMVLRDIEEFLCLSEEELFSSSRYSEHRLVSMETDEVGLLSISKQKNLTEEAKSALLLNDLDGIAKAYLQGADVSFSALYDHLPVRIVSLPTYAFSKQRCWFEGQGDSVSRVAETKAIHPLLDRCITDSYGLRVYEKRMSLQTCMELREHRIQGICVLPGTVYVEIANEIGKRHFGQTAFRFQSVTFFSLLTCNEKEERVLHCIAKEDGNSLHITIASCGDDGQWLQHIEATLCRGLLSPSEPVDLAEVLSSYPQVLTQQQDDAHEFVQLGQHWQTGLKIYASENSVILYSEVPEAFRTEASVYDLYPPLLDGSMNSGILLLEGKYLPLNYKNMQFYSPLRGSTYSRITRLTHRESNDEIALFHVELFDPQGRLIGEVEEYALKRVNDAEHFLRMPQEEQSMYQICWEQQTESIQPISAPSKLTAVVLLRPEQQNSSIVSQFRNRFRNVILFMLSDRYFRETDSRIYITNQEQDMRQAVLTLGDLKSVLFINLLAFCEDPADLHAGVELKLLTAFHFIKVLSGFAGKKSLCMITQNAIAVNGEEKFYAPLNQALIGFCSCIESEQSDMEISVIDTDPDTSAAVLAEAVCANQVKYIHAFRRNQLYLERISNDIPVSDPIEIYDSDVIVIPGGYGGIGLAICDALFQKAPHARIILLSRSPYAVDSRREKLHSLEDRGYHIRLLQADVTDETELGVALNSIRREYGKIDGVILAAGVAGDGMLLHKSWDTAWSVLAPKILGSVLLDRLTEEDPIRYMILFSSFTSAVGAPGQTDYTAANAFLDSFTYARNLRGKRTLTINWSGWKESGMAKDHAVDWQSSFVRFLTDEEGKNQFLNALEIGSPRIIACQFPDGLPAALERRFILPSAAAPQVRSDDDSSYDEEIPVIYGKSPDKLTDVERNISLAWARTLHVTEVNLYDKFFEAGGNSLLASYLQKEINRIYPDAMAITDVFVYSTIADISAYISGKLAVVSAHDQISESEPSNIEDLVQQFMNGDLSLEDIENLV